MRIYITRLTLSIAFAACGVWLFYANPLHAIAESASQPTTDPAATEDEISTQFTPYILDYTHRQLARSIIRTLHRYHYKNIELDDAFGNKILDSYIDSLDPNKSHFLQADIAAFAKYRDRLDDDLKRADLGAPLAIYNRFHQRRLERLVFLLDNLPERIAELQFDSEEYLLIDRDDSEWLSDINAAQDFWQRLLKNDVLNLKLSGKPEDEISSLLVKRYRNQLRLLQQINNNDVFDIFMSAYTHGYDPHTDYHPPQESENFDIHMRLSLEGIGALLQREDEYIKVVRLIPAGPADRSQLLQPADRIIGVGQGEEEIVDVVGWRLDDVVDMIRGPKGSDVRLRIIPASTTDITQTKLITLTRDTVKLEEESAKKSIIEIKRDDTSYKIGVIELRTFYMDFRAAQAGDRNYRSSARDVERLVEELKQDGIDGLVIDLRNNGGGSLLEAGNLTGLFIPTGPVVQIRHADNETEIVRDNNPKIIYTGPLAILVNRISASASEIFAGALQDYGRAIILGSQTFGKGTVQNITSLRSGQIKYTQSKFYRVSGDSTQVRGVIPDFTLPSLLSDAEIGESTFPEALPWDQIDATDYKKLADLTPLLTELAPTHQQRVANDPDFNYLQQRRAILDENRAQTSLSLNEQVRLQQREQSAQRLLAIENARRSTQGLKPFKTIEELEAEAEKEQAAAIADADNKKDNPDPDSWRREAGEVLLDWMGEIGRQYALQRD